MTVIPSVVLFFFFTLCFCYLFHQKFLTGSAGRKSPISSMLCIIPIVFSSKNQRKSLFPLFTQHIVHIINFTTNRFKRLFLRLKNFCNQPLLSQNTLNPKASAIWMPLSFVKVPLSGIWLISSFCCHFFKILFKQICTERTAESRGYTLTCYL